MSLPASDDEIYADLASDLDGDFIDDEEINEDQIGDDEIIQGPDDFDDPEELETQPEVVPEPATPEPNKA